MIPITVVSRANSLVVSVIISVTMTRSCAVTTTTATVAQKTGTVAAVWNVVTGTMTMSTTHA